MRIKCLVFVMSVMFLCVFSAPALAAWVSDPCGDAIITDKDLMKAKVEIFHDPDFAPPFSDESPWIYLCFELCEGNTMPGMAIWEFDIDSNSNTGGNVSMTGFPIEPCPCKTCPGYDILIQKVYRDQGKDATLSWCEECEGVGAQCAKPDLADPCPGDAGCFGIQVHGCNPYLGDGVTPNPNCETYERCVTAGCDNYYDFTGLCAASAGPCGKGKLRGEWEAGIYDKGGVVIVGGWNVDWGRDIPKPPMTSTDPGVYCEKLPYGEILRRAASEDPPPESLATPEQLDYALTHPPEWQLSIYYDPVFADEDDYFDWSNDPIPVPTQNITDWMPNGDCNKALGEEGCGGLCHMFQSHFHKCMDIMAKEGNFKDVAADFSACQAHHNNQVACEGDPLCSWDDPKCLACTPFSDTTFDGNVNAFDFGVLKYGWGRGQFPCCSEAP